MPSSIAIKAEYLMLITICLTSAVISHAFYMKKQFYPSMVYLTKSSSSLAVLYSQAFIFALLLGKMVQKIFLGHLRAIEVEHLYDRIWFSITETCLAFTVFRDDFSPRFVALFAILLFLKCFHWLLEDRVDYMEQSPVLGSIFHVRVISLLSVLFLFDYLFISAAFIHTMVRGASAQIIFGFEYAILLVALLSIAMKYILHLMEIQTGDQWENKGVLMLYADLVLGFCRVVLYMFFMIVMMKTHTFPLFAIRPMFLSLRTFRKSCNDVIESRRAIRDLNTMYPDLTAEELTHVPDTTCIICREEMQAQQSIKRLACQHIFHKHCLRSWFQRQQTCPICRTTVLRATLPRTVPNAPAPPHRPTGSEGPSPVPPPSSSSSSINFSTFSSPMNFSFTPLSSFPMALPPFAFPPPPMPPLNFLGLSEEEIRAMEQSEIAHVQARLQCLRNVRSLLDVSLLQMEQFTNIVSTQSQADHRSSSLTNNKSDSTTEIDDKDLVRRRRLEHFAERLPTSPSHDTEEKLPMTDA